MNGILFRGLKLTRGSKIGAAGRRINVLNFEERTVSLTCFSTLPSVGQSAGLIGVSSNNGYERKDNPSPFRFVSSHGHVLKPSFSLRHKTTLNARSHDTSDKQTKMQSAMKSTCSMPYSDDAAAITPKSVPNFYDPSVAHSQKSLSDIFRAIFVYRMCQIGPIVRNAESLLSLSRKTVGNKITDKLLKTTFFRQFCAGEDENEIQPFIESLKKNGIGGILDYAAESDGEEVKAAKKMASPPPYNLPPRDYDDESEEECDRHVDVFLRCIHAVKEITPDGFAALKVTALGNPKLLERMSVAYTEAKNLFAKFDVDGNGVISHEEFERGYRMYFVDADEKLPELMGRIDPDGSGEVDYITWSKLLNPSDLPRITSSCREKGPLAHATPTEEELKLMEAMNRRTHAIAEEAFNCGLRVLVDAEHTKFQPAIDNVVLELQQMYNATDKTDIPIIFNTYQCYLKDMPHRMIVDVERARRFSYHFAAKLVRGAYMEGERAKAAELGYPSPIHDTIENTHKCYNDSVEFLLRHKVETGQPLELMCATHNQESIEKAIRLMNELDIEPTESTVHFAQLYGMSDNLTYALGKHNYRAYKYVPYGQVNEVMPYLLRRAQENSAVLGNAAKELELLHGELKRRLLS